LAKKKQDETKVPAKRKNRNGATSDSKDIQVSAERPSNKDGVTVADGNADVMIPQFNNNDYPNPAMERLGLGDDVGNIESYVRMAIPIEYHEDVVGVLSAIEACDQGWVDDEKYIHVRGALWSSVTAWKDFKDIAIGQIQARNPVMGFLGGAAERARGIFNGGAKESPR